MLWAHISPISKILKILNWFKICETQTFMAELEVCSHQALIPDSSQSSSFKTLKN